MPSPLYRKPIHIAGAPGRYSLYGTNPHHTTLLIVSPVAGLSAYERTARELARHSRVYLLELPGGESTSRLPEGWDPDRYADWVANWMNSIGLTHIHTLIGHSNSGPVVMELAPRWPKRAGRLILAGSIGAEPKHTLLRVILAYARGVTSEGTFPLRAFWILLGNLVKQTASLCHQRKLALDKTFESLASRVNQPTILLWGRHDYLAGLNAPHRFAQWIGANARIVWRKTGGHDWLIVEPQTFAQTVHDQKNLGNSIPPPSLSPAPPSL